MIEEQFKIKQLDRHIETIKGAISGARSTLLLGNIIAFIILTALYNATLGWNRGQLDRRAQLANVASKFKSDTSATSINGEFLAENGVRDSLWITLVFSPTNTSDLSYLKELDRESLVLATQTELTEHIKREKRYEVISLPFIGVEFTAPDIGVLGAIALILTGFWLIGSLKKQEQTLGVFIKENKKNVYNMTKNFSKSESQYVYESIVSSPLFSNAEPEKPESIFNIILLWLFFFPPFTLLFAFTYEWWHTSQWQIPLSQYWHVALTFWAFVIVTGVWVSAWIHERRTERILDVWADALSKSDEKDQK